MEYKLWTKVEAALRKIIKGGPGQAEGSRGPDHSRPNGARKRKLERYEKRMIRQPL
jgi:hypothetical protein